MTGFIKKNREAFGVEPICKALQFAPFCYPAGELQSNSAERAPIMTGAPLCVILSGHRAEQSPMLQ